MDRLDRSGATSEELWRTVVDDAASVAFGGPSLEPDSAYRWSCRQQSASGAWSEWADPLSFTTGLHGRWTAPFIAAPGGHTLRNGTQHTVYFRSSLHLPSVPGSARIYATALGVYQIRINGMPIPLGEQAPGWTSYEHRLHYQVADVAEYLTAGDNQIVALVGPGWWAGNVGWFGTELYGSRTAVSIELRVDGHDDAATHQTDGSWVVTEGPLLFSDLIHGESHDRTIPEPDDDPRPSGIGAEVIATPEVIFQAQPFPAMAAQEILLPRSIERAPSGRAIVDFGQHFSGRAQVRFATAGPRGRILMMRHGDAVTSSGELYTANLRTARQRDEYRLAGEVGETLTPVFAQHGFRYLELSSSGGLDITDAEVTAEVIHTPMPSLGSFSTDNLLVNQIQHNVRWSQKGNFLGLPIDCAQRDERLGWTGDINLFARTALFNYDCAGMLESWLTALADDQRADGAVRDIAPYPHLDPPPRDIQTGQPGWGDAMVGVPWEIYLHTGRLHILERHWPNILGWLGHLTELDSHNLLRHADIYGDWNSLETTAPIIVGTAWFARSARTASRIADLLGHTGQGDVFRRLYRDIRDQFVHAFVTADDRIEGDTQTGYVVALANDLLPERLITPATDRLVELISARDDHLATGFVGTAFLLPVLTDHGHADLAYRLLGQETFPSWGDQIRWGATSMWEHWNTWQPPGHFQDPAMNSFNHFALATVGQFLFDRVGGINPDADRPGYRHIQFRPFPDLLLGNACVELDTPGPAQR